LALLVTQEAAVEAAVQESPVDTPAILVMVIEILDSVEMAFPHQLAVIQCFTQVVAEELPVLAVLLEVPGATAEVATAVVYLVILRELVVHRIQAVEVEVDIRSLLVQAAPVSSSSAIRFKE